MRTDSTSAGNFNKALTRAGACIRARDWVGNKSLQEAWLSCKDQNWMWWLVRFSFDTKQYNTIVIRVLLAITAGKKYRHKWTAEALTLLGTYGTRRWRHAEADALLSRAPNKTSVAEYVVKDCLVYVVRYELKLPDLLGEVYPNTKMIGLLRELVTPGKLAIAFTRKAKGVWYP